MPRHIDVPAAQVEIAAEAAVVVAGGGSAGVAVAALAGGRTTLAAVDVGAVRARLAQRGAPISAAGCPAGRWDGGRNGD